MTGRLALAVVVLAVLSTAAPSDYAVTILRPPEAGPPTPQFEPAEKLAGRSISALFGPLAEVRVEMERYNLIGIEDDVGKLEERIRRRIDRATCLGRDTEIAWHRAPWLRGYILLKDGRIFPMEIMLSGVIVGGLFFADQPGPSGKMAGAPRGGVE